MAVTSEADSAATQDKPSGATPDSVGTVEEESGCSLLDEFAIFIQGLMALVALLSLFFKRMRERPQRPFMIWACDITKQGVGALFVHTLNVLTSLIAGEVSHSSHNPCVWYFLNVALDTTIGVFILFCWLHSITYIATNFLHIRYLESGQYGQPPSLWIWLRQTTVFSMSLFMTKVVVVIMFKVFQFLETFATWILSPLRSNPKAEVAVVMLIFPLIMNVVQFWLIDSVIKSKLYGVDNADDKPIDEGAWQVLDVDDDGHVSPDRTRVHVGADEGQSSLSTKRLGGYRGLSDGENDWGSLSSSRTSLVGAKDPKTAKS